MEANARKLDDDLGAGAMSQSFGSLHCHLVFSTKQREPLIRPNVQPRLHEYVGGILRNHSCQLVAAGGMADHLHLLVSLTRTMSVAEAVRLVKSNSSSWMRDEMRVAGFHWQNGYGAFSVSFSNLEQVTAYVANQEKHHRGVSFQEEFLELLRRHKIEWDERYFWD